MTTARPTINWSRGIVDWHLPKAQDTTTFLAVGDILLDKSTLGVAGSVSAEDGVSAFSQMKSLFQRADIVLGNLEGPLSDRGSPIPKYGPNFRVSPNMAEALRKVGFTVMGVANNHTRDYGDASFVDTLKHLERQSISTIGSGRDEITAARPVIVKKRNLSLGILAFTFRQESVARRDRSGAADLDDPRCYDSVRALRKEVDVVIVFLHLDGEYSSYPAPHRVLAARRFVDSGAEMVICHHPHVPQGIEVYRGKLIAYSLGNFVFPPLGNTPLESLGYGIEAGLTPTGTGTVALIPYRINCSGSVGGAICKPVPLSGVEHRDFMAHLRRISMGLKDADLVRRNWEGVAGMDAMAVTIHVLRAIMNGDPWFLWSSHLVSLMREYPVLLKRLVTGRILGDIGHSTLARRRSSLRNV